MSALKWNGPKAQAAIRAKVERLLHAAAILVVNRARVLLSVAGTGERSASGGIVPSQGKKKRVHGAFPSKPGEPPHKQTGRLRASVAWEVVGLIARVGTNVKYGRILELGGRLVKPRPWLRRALLESMSGIKALFASAGPKL